MSVIGHCCPGLVAADVRRPRKPTLLASSFNQRTFYLASQGHWPLSGPAIVHRAQWQYHAHLMPPRWPVATWHPRAESRGRQHFGSVTLCIYLDGLDRSLTRLTELRASKLHTACLGTL